MLRIKCGESSETPKLVPLKSVLIDATLCSFSADVTIKQVFRNEEQQPVEAVYCFPIEENAAVYSLTAAVDERIIHAELKEKRQAQQEYTSALQEGHGAYLLEQDEHSQDMFVMSVGALLPNKECRIEIKYVAELDLMDKKRIRFVVPTTIAPRYSPSVGGIAPPAGTQAKYVQSVPYTVDFRCRVNKLNDQVVSVSCLSHPVTVKLNGYEYEVTLSQSNTHLDRDILLDVELSSGDNAILAVEHNGDSSLALMAAFTPSDTDCQKAVTTGDESSGVTNEFIFVVDCSGSMQNENKIGLARQAMMLFLKSLPIDCHFNIIRFGSDFKTLFSEVTAKYNEKNAKLAEQCISSMEADLGGTELMRPLQWLQSRPAAVGRSRQIMLLTDGEVSNVNEVTELCRSMATSSRIFSFGVGHSPSRSLVKGVARATNGRFIFIPPGSSVDVYVAEQLHKALKPSVTGVKAKWIVSSLSSAIVQTVPAVAPPAYANDRLLFYALVDRESAVNLSGPICVELWNASETVRLGVASTEALSDRTDGGSINRLAAKAMIQELTYSKAVSGGSQQSRFESVAADDKKQRVVNISLKYNIVCAHTAFVGVERRVTTAGENPNAGMVLREIPIEISADDKHLGGFFPRPMARASATFAPAMLQCAMPMSRKVCKKSSPRFLSGLFSSAEKRKSEANVITMSYDPPVNSYPVPEYSAAISDLFSGPEQYMAPVTTSWPSNDQDVVRHLINLQSFDGLWKLSADDVQRLCNKPLCSFHSDITNDSVLLTTAIVIAMMETKFSNFQNLWSFVVAKAKQRIVPMLGNSDKFDALINSIGSQL